MYGAAIHRSLNLKQRRFPERPPKNHLLPSEGRQEKKKRAEYEASEALAGRFTKHGDVTLANFQAALQKSLLSLLDVKDVFDGLRVFHETAVFKRPKAHLIDSGLLNPMYAASYQKSVDILNVGLFLATDVKITSEWHSIAKLVGGARALITWVKSVELENPEDEEERSQILEDVKNMDMRGSINSGGQVLLFVKFTRFADQGWMSDGCMVTAANRIAAEASWNPPPKVYVANPTFAGFVLQEQHNRFVDTNNFIFSKCQDDMVIVFPIHVKVDIPRWCGAIFDIKRRSVWVYDPFHDKDYEAAAETILEKVYMPLISPAYQLEIRLYRAWRQRDGFSCGVYVAHWFDH
ncbi:hypothetical protein PC118_g21844 [Phytophthora cactorum]|uniref:Ubiquitin-like protease family profile domain-containing protein n=1 Tax=Phytophthora cactorum TaxID=29920 RepID=A0A8T1F4J0_9STRA|nr:hypothetical protein PC118_g21844 [Phytophthora cactorum]